MFRFPCANKQSSLANRFATVIAAVLITSFAVTTVYADEPQRTSGTSSQPLTGSRIQSGKRESEKDVGVIEVIMIGAVLEPGDVAETDAADATPALPMMRADEVKTTGDTKR